MEDGLNTRHQDFKHRVTDRKTSKGKLVRAEKVMKNFLNQVGFIKYEIYKTRREDN